MTARQTLHDQRKRAEGRRRLTVWFTGPELTRLYALAQASGESREEVIRRAVRYLWSVESAL